MAYEIDQKYQPEFLRDLSADRLRELIKEARAKFLELRESRAQRFGHVEKPHLFRKVRRDIARFKTVLRQ
jgi:ribosomal protein L29